MSAHTAAPVATALPPIGLGTWPLVGADATKSVLSGIEAGYRLIDTAAIDQFDLRIWVETSFDESLRRAKVRPRDVSYYGTAEAIVSRYESRFHPAQRIHLRDDRSVQHHLRRGGRGTRCTRPSWCRRLRSSCVPSGRTRTGSGGGRCPCREVRRKAQSPSSVLLVLREKVGVRLCSCACRLGEQLAQMAAHAIDRHRVHQHLHRPGRMAKCLSLNATRS